MRHELGRNAQDATYEAREGQRQSTQRRHAASLHPHLEEAVWPIVRAGLAEDLSPEQIVGSKMALISHEQIYPYIAAGRKAGGSLRKQLRCRKRRRRHRCGTPRQRQRFGGRYIAQRAELVDARQRVGD